MSDITLHKVTLYGAIFAALLLTQNDVGSRILACVYGAFTLICGRSAGVDLAIIVVAIFAVLSVRTRQHVLVWITGCYITIAFIAPLVAFPAFAALDSTGLLSIHPGTYAARLELWAEISKHVQSTPLVGHGADTMRNAVGVARSGRYFDNGGLLPSAHNIVLDLWFELGALGIAIYATLLAVLVRLIGTLRDNAHLLASSCFMIILIALSVDHRIWLSWVMGTMVMATIICALSYRTAPVQASRLGTPN